MSEELTSTLFCGAKMTKGHGDSAVCGEYYYDSTYQCDACKIKELQAKLAALTAHHCKNCLGVQPETCLYAQPVSVQHPDDAAVDRFAASMKAKLAKSRAKGRGGWEDKSLCSAEYLSELLRGHVDKGDPVDVANFCMMLQQRGEGISAPAQQVKL